MSDAKLSEDRSYGFIVGGIHLTENGKPITSVAPTCVYNDMTGTHVQAMWKFFIESPGVQAAMGAFNGALARELNALGDTYMVETGKADPKQLKEFGEMIKKALVNK